MRVWRTNASGNHERNSQGNFNKKHTSCDALKLSQSLLFFRITTRKVTERHWMRTSRRKSSRAQFAIFIGNNFFSSLCRSNLFIRAIYFCLAESFISCFLGTTYSISLTKKRVTSNSFFFYYYFDDNLNKYSLILF